MDHRLPVADPWFQIIEIDDSTTLIQEPYVDPWVSANIWHIRGDRMDLLIDTGMGIAPLRPQIMRHVADREPVVVITHAHLDHMGSAHEFADCWAHPLEPTEAHGLGTLSGPELLRILGADDAPFDPPADVMVSAIPHRDYAIADYHLRPVTPTRRLKDGDAIDLGGRVITVLHLPGHTPGSIGLYDAGSRALFTGDVIYDPLALLDGLHGSNVADYKKSVRRLLDLDVDTVYPGHGGTFDGGRLRELANEYLAG